MTHTGFMVMPFSNESARQCYLYSLKPIFNEIGIDLIRADEMFGVNPIADDIAKAINQASVVVVDISDNNPNVFYELGLAHGSKRNATIVITGTSFSEVPFDVRHIRIIKYENTIEGKVKFEEAIRKTLSTMMKEPTFYGAELDTLASLADLDLDFRLRSELTWSVLLLKQQPLAVDHVAHILYKLDGQNRGGGVIYGSPLARRNHLSIFGLIENRNDILSLSPKGEALATYWYSRGHSVEISRVQPIEEYEREIEVAIAEPRFETED